jgi:3-oxoacyl-[acyl-carrier-protein] synthase III
MIGIAALAHYIPETRVDNLQSLERLGFDEKFLRSKIGFLRTSRKADGEQSSDLALKAVSSLVEKTKLDLTTVETLVVVTQNPDGFGLPHVSAIVHGKLGLPKSCFAFDISLGCSGYVAGLSIVSSFMAANGMRRGLLVTSDPYSNVVDTEDRNTFLIFGDAASATLLAEDPKWTPGRFHFGTDGASSGALEVRANRKLHMNGRAVFDLCAMSVPVSVREAVKLNGLALEEIDRFILHQGSKIIADTIGARLGVKGKLVEGAADYGNTVSSSIPLLLETLDETEDRVVVVSGFGVGLGYATTVLTRGKRT